MPKIAPIEKEKREKKKKRNPVSNLHFFEHDFFFYIYYVHIIMYDLHFETDTGSSSFFHSHTLFFRFRLWFSISVISWHHENAIKFNLEKKLESQNN